MTSRILIACSALMWSATLASAALTAQSAAGDLPAGEAHDTMIRVCTDCHGLDTIQGQRRARGEWQFVVDDMLSRGAQASDAEAMTIVGYLVSNLGRVNVNRASADDIRAVLDLTVAEATAIVNYRAGAGEFKAVEDLKKVPGLDYAKVEGKKDRIAF